MQDFEGAYAPEQIYALLHENLLNITIVPNYIYGAKNRATMW